MQQDRIEYLNNLANEYGIDKCTVYTIADMLGESEDYDGLISTLEDFSF